MLVWVECEYNGKIPDFSDSVEVISLFPPGYPAETRKQQDRFEMDRIHYDTPACAVIKVRNE